MSLNFYRNILLIQGKIMTSKDVHNLIPQTYEYVISYGKKDFTDVIKFFDLELVRLSWNIYMGFTFLGRPFLVKSSRDETRGEGPEKCDMSIAGFEDGDRGLRAKEGQDL